MPGYNVRRAQVSRWLERHKPAQLHFTPTSASWMNQVELWFNTFQRRYLRRGDFPSADALEAAIVAFIATYNRLHAHPYRWTHSGDPLVA